MNIGEETKTKKLDQQVTYEYLNINEDNGLQSDKTKLIIKNN